MVFFARLKANKCCQYLELNDEGITILFKEADSTYEFIIQAAKFTGFANYVKTMLASVRIPKQPVIEMKTKVSQPFLWNWGITEESYDWGEIDDCWGPLIDLCVIINWTIDCLIHCNFGLVI